MLTASASLDNRTKAGIVPQSPIDYPGAKRTSSNAGKLSLEVFDLSNQILQHFFSIAKQHGGLRTEE